MPTCIMVRRALLTDGYADHCLQTTSRGPLPVDGVTQDRCIPGCGVVAPGFPVAGPCHLLLGGSVRTVPHRDRGGMQSFMSLSFRARREGTRGGGGGLTGRGGAHMLVGQEATEGVTG